MIRTIGAALAAVLLAFSVPGASNAQQTPVRIGVVFAMSGAHALLGKSVSTTIAAWLAQHKNQVGGRPVEVIVRDDGESPENSKRLAQELVINDHVDFLVGANATPPAMAIMSVSTSAKVPFFIVNANNEGILEGNPYSTRYALIWKDAVLPLARRALKDGAKTAYTISVDFASGILAQKIFGDAFTAGGGKVIGSLTVPLGNTEWSSYILRVKDAKPGAVFVMAAGGPTAISFLKAFNQAGLRATTKIYATADLTAEQSLPVSGDDALGAITSSNYTPLRDSALNRQFVSAFRGQISNPTATDMPSFMDAQFWTILTAIDKVVAAQKGPLDLTKTMATLRGLSWEAPQGPVSLDPQTRDLRQNVYLRRTERVNGQLVNVDFDTFTPQQLQ